jgi:hypothetical protein
VIAIRPGHCPQVRTSAILGPGYLELISRFLSVFRLPRRIRHRVCDLLKNTKHPAMTGPRDSSQESHRPSENDKLDPPRLTRLDSGSSSNVERVFPIRVVLPNTKQTVPSSPLPGFMQHATCTNEEVDIEKAPSAALLQAAYADLQLGESLQSADISRGANPHLADGLKPSVPLVSILPPSEDSSSSNKRYVTNTPEFIAEHISASSPAPLDGQKIYRCEDEPIHIPGAIQRFGALIAMRESAGVFLVRIVSDNSHSVVGIDPEALFDLRCFTDLLVSNDKNEFLIRSRALLSNLSARDCPDVFQISLTSLRGAPTPLYCAMHFSAESDLIICEFELDQDFFNPTSSPNGGFPEKPIQVMEHQATTAERLLSTTIRSTPLHALQMVRQGARPLAAMDLFQILSEIQAQLGATTELPELLDQIVGLVYELTCFHRVMVYQFDENAAGTWLVSLAVSSTRLPIFGLCRGHTFNAKHANAFVSQRNMDNLANRYFKVRLSARWLTNRPLPIYTGGFTSQLRIFRSKLESYI